MLICKNADDSIRNELFGRLSQSRFAGYEHYVAFTRCRANQMNSGRIVVAILCVLLFAGCGKRSGSTANTGNKVRVGYIGLTCEAPIYTAYEKGFFKEEGLEVELVKCSWATYKDTLALGGY